MDQEENLPATMPVHADEEDSSSSSESSDSEELPRDLLHVSALGVGAKRPVGLLEPEDEEGDGEETGFLNTPDVGAYLTHFALDPEQQIALCRTWANYLAAKNRPKKYSKK